MKKIISLLSALLLAAGCSSDQIVMVVGTYTDSGSYGLYSYRFDAGSGVAAVMDSVAAVNPSFAIYRDGKVYSVNEINGGQAAVETYGFDRRRGRFSLEGHLPASGADPCHLSTDGHFLLSSNYTGGNLAVFAMDGEGRLETSAVYAGSTGGPDLSRQETAHIHCSVFSPDGKYVYASDFSADRILRFDAGAAGIVPSLDAEGQQVSFPLDPDYGPRHLVFSPDGRFFYVIGELSGTVTSFRYDDGNLVRTAVVDADPYDGRGSADIHLSPDGRFLYVSNRLVNDGISVFGVKEDGSLSFVAYQTTGIHPRNFNITPDGRYLLCACRDSDMIQVFERDAATGLLTDTGRNISVPHPVCIEWVR